KFYKKKQINKLVIFMMDQINNSNIQNQLLCLKHYQQSEYLQFASDNEEDLFCCYNCLYEECYKVKNMIPLEKIQSCEEDHIIFSWPPLDEQDLVCQIYQISQYDNPISIQKLIQFFDELETEIITHLQKQKKAFLVKINNISTQNQELLDFYSKISKLSDIKGIIQDQNLTQLQKAKQVLAIINKMKEKSTENTHKLKQMLQKSIQQKAVDLQLLTKLKNSILKQLSFINSQSMQQLQQFLEKNYCLIEQQKSENNLQNENIKLQENGNLDTILKLVANKTNQCDSKYLDSLQSELLKIQVIINDLKIEKNVFLPSKQQINFQDFTQEQIDDIHLLSKKISEMNNKYRCSQEQEILSFKIQPSSYSTCRALFNQNIIKQNKLNYYYNLLKKYPIFEFESFYKSYFNCRYQLQLSSLNNSQQYGQIIQNNSNYIFQVVQQSNTTTAYMKINQASLYRVVVEMNLHNVYNKYYIFVGLISNFSKDNTYISDVNKVNSFAVDRQSTSKGVSKIVKGRVLKDLQYPDDYKQIEITFCVESKLFQVCDYPNRENVNEIDDNRLYLLNTSQEYLLGFQLFNNGDSITILQCEELEYQN
ncbi:hypothetical protein TTHERM_01415190, partial (macronuclear) [Tetrahymena thermophila SB210]